MKKVTDNKTKGLIAQANELIGEAMIHLTFIVDSIKKEKIGV